MSEKPLAASINPRGRLSEHVFFSAMAVVMTLTAFAGFAHSYYLRAPAAPPLSPLLRVHGLIMTAWMLLYTAQSGLIAAHRVNLHRRLGIAGVGLAVLLIVMVTITSFVVRGFTPSIVFSAGAVLMLVVYLYAGASQRRNSQAHKRWMMLFTMTLLPPAIARLHLPYLPAGSVGPNLAGLAFLLPAFAYDLAAQRRIHPALLWGGLFMIAMLPLRALVKSMIGG